MKSKINVGVIFGGRSVENEISVLTAIQAMEAINTDKYDITPIYISKQGVWYTGEALRQSSNYKNMETLLASCQEVYLRPTAEEGAVPASVSGLAALRTPDEAAAFAAVRRLIGLLPAHSREDCTLGTAFDASTACGVWNPDDALGSMKSISDDGSAFLLWEDYGKGLLTAFMPIAGAVTAVIASDPSVNGGAIGAEEAKKAAKLISFADAFALPVVTLVDSVGVSDSS